MSERQPSGIFDRVVSGIIVCCAVAVTWRLYHRPRPPVEPLLSAVSPAEWEAFTSFGHRTGPESASVTIVEFADFQCPACRQFAQEILPAALARSPGEIAVIFRHWPLTKHPAAYPAARAAECAAAQGRFVEFHDALFQRQEQIESRDWWSFAGGIGGMDSSNFITCVQSDSRVAAIERDILAAERTGSPGTPTILINGLRFNRPPSPDEVARLIDSLAGRGRGQ